MKILKALRTLALAALVGSFLLPGAVYGACEESIVCESQGSEGCYYHSETEDGFECWAHSCDDGSCSSGCSDGEELYPGICPE